VNADADPNCGRLKRSTSLPRGRESVTGRRERDEESVTLGVDFDAAVR
jgi:hypothetical protein